MPGAGVPPRISQQAAGKPEFSAYWLRIRKRTALQSGFVCGIWASLAACRETTQNVIPRPGLPKESAFSWTFCRKQIPRSARNDQRDLFQRPATAARQFVATRNLAGPAL